MSKPKPSSPANPWEALFASAARPRPVADGGASSAGGYTVLLQHSLTPKAQRQSAAASTVARADPSRNTGGAAAITPSMAAMALRPTGQGSGFGIAGPFLVRRAFEELCHRCDGAVVFVSTIGMSDILDLDELGESDDDGCPNGSDEEGMHDRLRDNAQDVLGRRRTALQTFHRNGAVVDLSSNPFGWDDDDETEATESFVQQCSMERLQPIVAAVRRVATHVENRRPPSEGEGRPQLLRPIPIVFESLTPLLHMHGADKVSLLFKSIGRSSETGSSEVQPILSPIVAPILYESVGPSEHRCLEDAADALVHLNLANGVAISSVPPAGPSSIPMASGMMDLVRRGGGGSSLGGKLIRHCVPLRIMRNAGSCSEDARADCYWILGSGESDNAKEFNEGQHASEESDKPTVATEAAPPGQTKGPSRPKIYLEDDDPEFQDLDAEDDDLDL